MFSFGNDTSFQSFVFLAHLVSKTLHFMFLKIADSRHLELRGLAGTKL